MNAPRSPYKEIVDAENQNILATLTRPGWARMAVAMARARFYEAKTAEDLLDHAMQTSGAIGGEHRQHLVDSIQGAKVPTMPMAIGAPIAPPRNEVGRL